MMTQSKRLSRRRVMALLALAIQVGAAGSPALWAAGGRARGPVIHLVHRGPGKTNVSLNLDRAPIKAVLRLLFRRANQSYVFGPRVGGTVTASLHNLPFDTALDQILSVNSVPLTKTMVKGVYVIKGRRRPQDAIPPRTRTTLPPTARPARVRVRRSVRPRGFYRPRPPRTYSVPGTGGGVQIVR